MEARAQLTHARITPRKVKIVCDLIRGKDTKIAAAGCVLPLTQSRNLSKDLGMRHRAGIGLSEQSDAVVVIVSEETGAISLAIDGMLKRHLNAAALTELLHKELVVDEEKLTWKDQLKRILQRVLKRT